MSTANSSEVRSLKQTLRLVGSSEAFTKRVALWTLPIGLFVAVSFDAGRFGTSRVGWFFVGLVAHAFATMVLLVLRRLFLPPGPYAPKPFKTLSIFVIGSMSRSIVVGLLSVQMDLASNSDLFYRAIAGALLGTLTLSVMTLVAATIKEHAITQAELAIEHQALVTARDSAQEMVDQQRFEIFKIVKESIEPSVAEITQNLADASIQDSSKLQASAAKISNLIDSKLRPLSSSLHTEQKIAVPKIGVISKKPSLISLPKTLILRRTVSPLAIYLVFIVPNVTGSFPYLGLSAVPVVFLAYVPMLVILYSFLWLPFSSKPVTTPLALMALGVVLSVAWTPAIFITRSLEIDIIDRLNLIPALTLASVLLGLLITYGFILDNQRSSYESQLRNANQELNLELNRTSQLIWHVRQRAAQTLHGSVQASLTAANMRILGATQIDDELLEKVRQDLVRATESLTNLDDQNIDLSTSLADLVELWQGVCEIEVLIPDVVMKTITDNQVTANCVNEIVRESVTNAIRHGKATEVQIVISKLDSELLQIEISNDGVTSLLGAPGVGSQILDEITMNWTRELLGNQVRVSAQVALA